MTNTDGNNPATLVRQFLANLLQAALTSDDQHCLEWTIKAGEVRKKILSKPKSDLAALKIDGLWWLAIKDAEQDKTNPEQGKIEWGQPKICPITLDEVAAQEFDLHIGVRRLRESAATG